MAMKPAKALAIAATNGDLEAMRQIIQGYPDAALDWQPIMDACFHGQVEAVRMLLDAGADPNILSKSAFKYRPLHRTIEPKVTLPRTDRHVEVVNLLLAAGADPLLPATYANISAVGMAAMAGEQRFLDLLTPYLRELDLNHAAILADLKTVRRLLVDHPELAKVNPPNGFGPLMFACRSGLGGKDPEARTRLQQIIRLLIEHGADPANALDPLVYLGDPELVNLLMDHGATIQDGDTLNHASANRALHPVLDILVRRGVDLNLTAGTEHHGGYTPFGCALTCRSAISAAWFLDHGVDPNYVGGPDGESSLHVAVRSGAGEPLLKLLVSRGASLSATDERGMTPLQAARENGNAKAVAFLESLTESKPSTP